MYGHPQLHTEAEKLVLMYTVSTDIQLQVLKTWKFPPYHLPVEFSLKCLDHQGWARPVRTAQLSDETFVFMPQARCAVLYITSGRELQVRLCTIAVDVEKGAVSTYIYENTESFAFI